MTPATGRGIASRLADWPPLVLVVVAEAAWISVVEGLLQVFVLRRPSLGIAVLAGSVVVGIVLARLVGGRAGRWWPPAALAAVAVAAALGALATPAARLALDDGPLAAMALNPGGWTAGLAVLRGFAHARAPLAEGTVARLLGLGVPAIACFAIIGGAIVEPFRTQFLTETLVAAVVFAGAAILALTLARVGAIGEGAGFDWRRNPSWLGLTLLVLAVAIVVAVPVSALAGQAIQALLTIALVPLFILGLGIGLDRGARRLLAFVAAAAVLVLVVLPLVPIYNVDLTPFEPASGPGDEAPVQDQIVTAGLGGLLLVAAIVAVLVLAVAWMRRVRPIEDDPVAEARTIDLGSEAAPPHRRRRWLTRRPDPASAAQAYVALVDDLERHADVRRGPAETPAEHAARLRAAARSDLRLDLLAADYALARYGGVALPERENRRAVARWRLLRRRLPQPPAGRAGTT